MLNDWVVESDKRNRQTFMNIRTIFRRLILLWKLHYIKQEARQKRLQETFEAEVKELQYGSPAVAHS